MKAMIQAKKTAQTAFGWLRTLALAPVAEVIFVGVDDAVCGVDDILTSPFFGDPTNHNFMCLHVISPNFLHKLYYESIFKNYTLF
jgi:hypothetical protein